MKSELRVWSKTIKGMKWDQYNKRYHHSSLLFPVSRDTSRSPDLLPRFVGLIILTDGLLVYASGRRFLLSIHLMSELWHKYLTVLFDSLSLSSSGVFIAELQLVSSSDFQKFGTINKFRIRLDTEPRMYKYVWWQSLLLIRKMHV